jgi:hypothetical protein
MLIDIEEEEEEEEEEERLRVLVWTLNEHENLHFENK